MVAWSQRAIRIRSIFSTMMERIAVRFTCHMHRETGWTAFSTSPTRLAISRCAELTRCRLLSRSEISRRAGDQAAGVSSPAFIRTHADECGKYPYEVDNQRKTAPIRFLEYRRLASRIDGISSRNAGRTYRLARAGALRGQIPCLTKAVLPGTALVFKGQVLP